MTLDNPFVAGDGAPRGAGLPPRVWEVGALCRAVADALEARFNPVAVRGELIGFSRAASGHCYFSLRDGNGQIRCAMFRRAASLLDFEPRDGEQVELRGRLGVYEQRGDLQLIVESLRRAGTGALFEQFLRLKAQLEAEGLFASGRKRPLPLMPQAIGLVTSLGAAALHDVVTALQRRVPHIPVVLAPAAVQGVAAPAAICEALSKLYQHIEHSRRHAADSMPQIEAILVVRGGGALEDLMAFNDERVARRIAESPVPVVSGVGHETDFTIADFVADLRAPTPTAAAELVAQPQAVWLDALELIGGRLQDVTARTLDRHGQRLDRIAAALGRPSTLMARQQQALARRAERLRLSMLSNLQQRNEQWRRLSRDFDQKRGLPLQRAADRLDRAALRLSGVDPRLVLQRGYAWLTDDQGRAVTRAADAPAPGRPLRATLHDGAVDLTVADPRHE